MLFFTIGKITYSAGTPAQLSRIYASLRDESGEGNSTWPKPTVTDTENNVFGYFSYNGRIWAEDEKTRDHSSGKCVPLYAPPSLR